MMIFKCSNLLGTASLWLSVLIQAFVVPAVWAEDARSVLPDLTELPAELRHDADQSVQLAVTSAGDRLVSVGEQGIVLISDDSGLSWRQSGDVPVSVTLTSVAFVSDTHGWAAGHSGVVLQTTDAGEHWRRVIVGSDLVNSIQADTNRLDEDSPLADTAQGNSALLNGSEPALDLYIDDSGEGWLVGAYGIAMHTRDLGKNWHSAFSRIDNPNSSHLYHLVTGDDGVAMIVGERGYVARFSESSGSFIQLDVGYEGTFFGGLMLANNDFLLYGLRGNIWYGSENNWQQVKTPTQTSFNSAIRVPSGALLGDVAGRLFLFSSDDHSLHELTITADAAITDLVLNSRGELIMATARGLKVLAIDNLEFK